MKLHTIETAWGQVNRWYDPKYGWVVQQVDTDGNQIGDAQYLGGVSKAEAQEEAMRATKRGYRERRVRS